MVLAPATRVAVMGLAVAVGLGLSACVTPREPPPGPTDAETVARTSARIEQAWMNTGLEGTVDRPEVASFGDPVTFDTFAACIAAEGITEWGLEDGSNGPSFTVGSGGASTAHQLAFYTCFALYPTDISIGLVPLTREQLDYLYDYYRSWVMPCLALDSVVVSRVPSREQFVSENWPGWNPYDYAELSRSDTENVDAIRRCGPIYADLDVVDPFARAGAQGTSSFTIAR